jgi:hypothetical protein
MQPTFNLVEWRILIIIRVKLSEIVEAMDMQTEQSYHYLNIETGEIVYVTDEEFSYAEEDILPDKIPEWQRPVVEAAKEISEGEKYIQLPDKFEIHEYHIMEEFCLSINDEQLRNEIYSSIKGRGAFRRFKENIHRFNISNDWYRYREAEFYRIARHWCEFHKIEYHDDQGEVK